MRVACGLDSLILGEPQILGQVKQAFQISEDYYQAANIPLSSTLSRLFQKTFATAKRVRTETNIGCLLYTSPSPRDRSLSRMPSSA